MGRHQWPGAPAELPAGTVAFLFTDPAGSTRLLEAHPDTYQEAVRRHHALLRGAVAGHGGAVFEAVGDAVYVAFHRPTDAVAAVGAAWPGERPSAGRTGAPWARPTRCGRAAGADGPPRGRGRAPGGAPLRGPALPLRAPHGQGPLGAGGGVPGGLRPGAGGAARGQRGARPGGAPAGRPGPPGAGLPAHGAPGAAWPRGRPSRRRTGERSGPGAAPAGAAGSGSTSRPRPLVRGKNRETTMGT